MTLRCPPYFFGPCLFAVGITSSGGTMAQTMGPETAGTEGSNTEATTFESATPPRLSRTRGEQEFESGGAGPRPPFRAIASFELGLTWLALPTAEVCERDDCRQGDNSPLLELWGLARVAPRIAVGAGASWGYFPTRTIDNDSDDDSISSRNYLTFEATGRYYLVERKKHDWWVGAGAGLMVLGDRFVTEERPQNEYVRIGDYGAQLSTVGSSAFVGTGFAFHLTRHFHLGGGLRAGGYFLPSEPRTTSLGHRSSLTGANLTVSGGLVLTLTSGA